MSKRKYDTENSVEIDTNGTKSKKVKPDEQSKDSHGSLDIPGSSELRLDAKSNKSRLISKESLRIAKIERRRKKKVSRAVSGTQDTSTKPRSRDRSTKKTSESGLLRWSKSDPVGGRLIDLDPVFSVDEQYLLIAYECSIDVYAVSTSLRVRTLRTSKSGTITGFTIPHHLDSHIYIAISSGVIEEWNWIDGRKLSKWDIRSNIFGLTSSNDVLYTVDRKGQWMITAHRLKIGDKTELQTLYKSPDPITHFKIVDDGRTIVASAAQRLIVGSCAEPNPPNLRKVSYTWREFECSEWITSLDARIDPQDLSTHSEKSNKVPNLIPSHIRSISIVVGGLKGSLYVYQDLVEKLERMERAQTFTVPTTRHMHWHRSSVGAVKWSLDGNYIISGGTETTMVLWQLDTGRKQFLPHLSATIESIVVAPSGISYAVRLANNSLMILSTSELQPTFSISGIQIPVASRILIEPPQMVAMKTLKQIIPIYTRVAAAVRPMAAGQLLVAVPAVSSLRSGLPTSFNSAFLQTLEVKSGFEVSRQALTRTKVTALNMGPESNIIEEPNVVLLQLSHDGQWLATVDEWKPPTQDINILAFSRDDLFEEQRSRMEVYLKFWKWNKENSIWELVSRIDSPHNGSGAGDISTRVLDMVADPSSVGFTTIGQDGLVKSWKPKTRFRDGIKVRMKDGESLINWSCSRSTSLPKLEAGPIEPHSSYMVVRAAISSDGSLLMVGHQSGSASIIHLIDTATGEIHHSRSDLLSGELLGLGIIDKYLILLSDALVIWDLVDERINYVLSLGNCGLQKQREVAATHLAVDHRHQTFALAVPEIGQNAESATKVMSRLGIFNPSRPNPLFTTLLPRTLRVLLPAAHQQGYITVDSAAEIQCLTPSTSFFQPNPDSRKANEVLTAGLENLFKAGITAKESRASEPIIDAHPVDSPVVRQHQLADIFDVGPSFALPSMTSLLEQVADICSEKLTR